MNKAERESRARFGNLGSKTESRKPAPEQEKASLIFVRFLNLSYSIRLYFIILAINAK